MKLFAALSAFSASVEAFFCGGTITQFQSISSPGHVYAPNLDCSWFIELGDVPGFNIVNNLFDVEYDVNCIWDYLTLVDGSGYERNFCGEISGRKRRSGDEKEGGKYTPDLVNVSSDGFPDRVFIAGGSATIRFHSDPIIQKQGFDFGLEKLGRFQIIMHHVGRVIDSVADEKWGGRYAGRMQKALDKLEGAGTGASCYEENFPDAAGDEGDEVTVFDADNMCKLNGQVNAAINSYARNNACVGRGKVYRQIIRSARKVKNFFNDNNDC